MKDTRYEVVNIMALEENNDNVQTVKHKTKITAKVVSSQDEMNMVIAIRACVFLGKPGWTYEHTFDANDHCATHIIGFINDEPCGTVRIRWFRDFARIERIAIREEFRSLILLNKIATTALRLCRKKGYDKVGGLTYPGLIGFWGRHGAKPVGEAVDSEYGAVVPILGEPKHWEDITPITLEQAGSADFEWQVYGYEGAGL